MLEQLVGRLRPVPNERTSLFETSPTARWGILRRSAALYDRAWADVEQDDARFARWLAFRAWARLLESDNARALAV